MNVLTLSDRPHRLGVAFSGGGARGFAHAGALEALEEMGLKPDIVAGVSAGAVICALYAAGVKPADMIKLFVDIKFSTCCQLSVTQGGVFKLDKFKQFIKRALGRRQLLEQLDIPTFICATDLDRGVPVAFSSGPIADSVIASCSIPVLFCPHTIGGVNYVDGGVLRNLPAWAIRERCHHLIGLNCSPLARDKYKKSIIEVAQRTYRLMAKTNVELDIPLCDLVIETKDIAHYSTFNMKQIERVYKAGYDSAMHAIKRNLWITDPLD